MVVVEADGTIALVNAQTERLFGRSRAELLGQPAELLLPERFHERHRAHRSAFTRAPAPRPMGAGAELFGVKADGTEFPVEISLSPLKTPDGTVLCAAIRDITDRRQVEAHMALAKALIDSADAALFSVTLDGRILSWNPGAERMYGWSADEIVGRSVLQLEPSDRTGEVGAVLDRLGGGEEVAPFETVRARKDGELIDVMVGCSPQRDGHGEVVGAAVVTHGLAEVRRRDDMAHAKALVDSSVDAIIGQTLDGRISSWNPGAQGLYGWSAEEVVGRSTDIIVPEDRRDEHQRALAELAAGVQPDPVETERVDRWGGRKEISLRLSPIVDSSGNVVGVSGVGRDITMRRRYTQLRQRARELELTSEQALQASRLKSEFVANMSHELRTPLNSVIGFAELLYEGRVGEMAADHKEFVGDILEGARHLLVLINDVLDLAKVEAGKMEFRPEVFDVEEAVSGLRDMLAPQAAGRGIGLTVDDDDRVGEVQLDPARFRQVVFNYASNALKFTEDGGAVTLRAANAGQDHFRIEVEDTGHGIDASDLHRLFVDFEQLDSGTAKRHAGTGLGLALTRRLVEAQGGSVGVRSHTGKGSLFHAVLPRSPKAGQRRPSSLDLGREVPLVAILSTTGDRWIDQLQDELQGRIDVRLCAEVSRASGLAASRQADAVVIDTALPGNRAADAIRQLRQVGGRSLPIVVMAGSAGSVTLPDLGADGLVGAPPEPEELIEALAALGVGAPA